MKTPDPPTELTYYDDYESPPPEPMLLPEDLFIATASSDGEEDDIPW